MRTAARPSCRAAAKTQPAIVAVPTKKPTPAPVEVAPPSVVPGQIVYLSVLPKTDLAGNVSDSSPAPFATREAAQADCDRLNATRMPSSQFVVRETTIR